MEGRLGYAALRKSLYTLRLKEEGEGRRAHRKLGLAALLVRGRGEKILSWT